jgi:citrate lyase beta subunit
MAAEDDLAAEVDARLAADDEERLSRYRGPSTARQPVHTVYVPADLASPTLIDEWRQAALEALDTYGPLPSPGLAALTDSVRSKLAREPIEDLRLDLEDGYGIRSDAEEDLAVTGAARLLHALLVEGLVPFGGVRIKSFDPAVRRRALRSLELFVAALAELGPMPDGLRITLPKVTSVVQVEVMAEVCGVLESSHRLDRGALRIEIQVETPQAVLGADGTALVARMIGAAGGRCIGLHYGTYDYSASLGISPAEQRMDHPVADYAKAIMQVAAAGTGVVVSDGSTNLLPVGSDDDVRAAWALHARLVRRSLDRGLYQGWDLHPAQLPTRYAATYAFYREGLPKAAERLRGYLERTQTAVAEEPATAQALAAFLLRSVHSGAVAEGEVLDLVGVSVAELITLVEAGRGTSAPETGA